MSGRRRPNPRAIKVHRNYTVDEAARVLGVCRGTVRRWIGGGLPALRDRRPILILGGDLIDFLNARSRPRSRCRLGELYCVRCRAPRAAAGCMADFIPLTARGGNLQAICEECGILMNRWVSSCQLKTFEAILTVSIREAARGIGDCTLPSLNDHLHEETDDYRS